MKQKLLILLLTITFVIAETEVNENEPVYARRWADFMDATEDIETCSNKTGVTDEDLMQLNIIVDNSRNVTDFDDQTLRVGCFLSCLAQKKGLLTDAKINTTQMKKLTLFKVSFDVLLFMNRLIEVCAKQVEDVTNQCIVSLKFMTCII